MNATTIRWVLTVMTALVLAVATAGAVEITHTTANLSVARYELAATTVGSQAVIAGGYWYDGNRHYCSDVDIYDAASGTWTTSSMSEGHMRNVAASAGGKALIAGGWKAYDEVPTSVIEIYNPAAPAGARWSSDNMSTPRWDFAASAVGDKVLFGGGSPAGWQWTRRVDIYDVPSGTMVSGDYLAEERSQLSAATAGQKVLFAGGARYHYNTALVDIYHADAGGTWTTSSLSMARCRMAAISAGDLAFFAGGEYWHSSNGHTPVSRVDIFDASTGSWTTAELSEARADLAATVVGDLVFFGGGWAGGSSYTDVVDVYDMSTGLWSTLSLSAPRSRLAATAVGNQVIFAGGSTGSAPSNVVDIFTVSGDGPEVPEPATMLAGLAGIAGVGRYLRRRK